MANSCNFLLLLACLPGCASLNFGLSRVVQHARLRALEALTIAPSPFALSANFETDIFSPEALRPLRTVTLLFPADTRSDLEAGLLASIRAGGYLAGVTVVSSRQLSEGFQIIAKGSGTALTNLVQDATQFGAQRANWS